MTTKPKRIVIGICGGIAAYKICEVVRLLVKQGHAVQVALTKAAQEFVTPLTLQTLSQNPVATNLFDLNEESKIGHITLADSADVILIAPATADIIAKAALGLCDDIVSTVLLATKAPVFMAPSMNVNMYEHPAVQQNLKTLKSRGVSIIEPESGELACGWNGIGRLAEPARIVQEVLSKL